ncbi:G-type lectin S-receptor-like serine/threonine-protein kinase At5g35370 [Fagus crenata]
MSNSDKLSLTVNGVTVTNQPGKELWSAPPLNFEHISARKSLESSVTDEDFSVGDYRLEVPDMDVVLQWNRMNYWKLSMDPKASNNSNEAVSLMVMNDTGLYLLGSDGSTVVIHVVLSDPPGFRIGNLGLDGRFSISNFMTDKWVLEIAEPFENCDIPC